MICHDPKAISIPMVPKANHLTRVLVLSFVSRSFCSLPLRYSISVTISATNSSMRRNSASTGLSFSVAWTADQSFASAPISISSSTWRVGSEMCFPAVGSQPQLQRAEFISAHEPVKRFSKQTSNAESACEVNAILFSPTTSFGLPYSLPTASLICRTTISIHIQK